jgi:hypothetical protein
MATVAAKCIFMTRIRPRFRLASRAALKRLAVLFLLLVGALVWCWIAMIRMPGKSFDGPLPPLSQRQSELASELHRDVDMLAGIIGRRSVFYPKGLNNAVEFIDSSLSTAGFRVQRQEYEVLGVTCANLEVELRGASSSEEIVVIGAHYDSVDDSPAANDNGSGVAATLALARRFANAQQDRTLRFVFFVNEEPPFFQTSDMGSLVYATRCRERNENIVAMLSLETIGYYSDTSGSQTYPVKPVGWLYPNTGDFIGFVGNYASRHLVRNAIGSFREHAKFPSEGAALPGWITGVGWSDHWSFWQQGYPAIMITDTAPFRYPFYHSIDDTPDKLDYQRMARVVDGLANVISELCDGGNHADQDTPQSRRETQSHRLNE